MSKQDKATTERHAKILRELIKQPQNKLCADCKRNDPRWASWNLGVFLCIRCSGIHRGMGTHISRVKSVDLDVWTPEQMESIQKWGNYRANLYWEAHLKSGHIPPDHKMESFIRSKYESRRWALEGPPPSDPSSLENQAADNALTTEASIPQPSVSIQSTNSSRSPAPPVLQVPSAMRQLQSQTQPRQLLSTSMVDRSTPINAAATPSVQGSTSSQIAPEEDLFSLDFHAPPPSDHRTTSSRDIKQDILSLFSGPPTQNSFGQTNIATHQSLWTPSNGVSAQAQPAGQSPVLGTNSVGLWGMPSGWNSPVAPQVPSNVWGGIAQPQEQVNSLQADGIWSSSAATLAGNNSLSPAVGAIQKKDDVFGDIWGDFK